MAEILHRDRTEIAADKADEPDVDHHQRGEHPQGLGAAQCRDDLQYRGRHEGEDRRLRHAPRAEAFDDRGVREIRSEEHTSELQSLMRISYAVFCLKKKKTIKKTNTLIRNNTIYTYYTNTTIYRYNN